MHSRPRCEASRMADATELQARPSRARRACLFPVPEAAAVALSGAGARVAARPRSRFLPASAAASRATRWLPMARRSPAGGSIREVSIQRGSRRHPSDLLPLVTDLATAHEHDRAGKVIARLRVRWRRSLRTCLPCSSTSAWRRFCCRTDFGVHPMPIGPKRRRGRAVSRGQAPRSPCGHTTLLGCARMRWETRP